LKEAGAVDGVGVGAGVVAATPPLRDVRRRSREDIEVELVTVVAIQKPIQKPPLTM
jgi:hypothetical protein